jgi:hypothetical protein
VLPFPIRVTILSLHHSITIPRQRLTDMDHSDAQNDNTDDDGDVRLPVVSPCKAERKRDIITAEYALGSRALITADNDSDERFWIGTVKEHSLEGKVRVCWFNCVNRNEREDGEFPIAKDRLYKSNGGTGDWIWKHALQAPDMKFTRKKAPRALNPKSAKVLAYWLDMRRKQQQRDVMIASVNHSSFTQHSQHSAPSLCSSLSTSPPTGSTLSEDRPFFTPRGRPSRSPTRSPMRCPTHASNQKFFSTGWTGQTRNQVRLFRGTPSVSLTDWHRVGVPSRLQGSTLRMTPR